MGYGEVCSMHGNHQRLGGREGGREGGGGEGGMEELKPITAGEAYNIDEFLLHQDRHPKSLVRLRICTQ